MYRVIKRDGSVVEFDLSKITKAIQKAFDACERSYTQSVLDLVSLRVTSDFEPKVKKDEIGVEDIQDSVEKVLSEAGYYDVAKAYILYRRQRENVRNIKETTLKYHNRNIYSKLGVSSRKQMLEIAAALNMKRASA